MSKSGKDTSGRNKASARHQQPLLCPTCAFLFANSTNSTFFFSLSVPRNLFSIIPLLPISHPSRCLLPSRRKFIYYISLYLQYASNPASIEFFFCFRFFSLLLIATVKLTNCSQLHCHQARRCPGMRFDNPRVLFRDRRETVLWLWVETGLLTMSISVDSLAPSSLASRTVGA